MYCSLSSQDSPDKTTGVGKPFPSRGDHPNLGIKPGSPTLEADSLHTALPTLILDFS